MPYFSVAANAAQDQTLVSACATALVFYVKNVLVDQAPVLYPNAGYRAYQKRTELAAKIIANPMEYGKRAAILAETIIPNIVHDIGASSGSHLHRYLIDTVFAEWRVEPAGGANTTIIGAQVWDVLAGVNQGDL